MYLVKITGLLFVIISSVNHIFILPLNLFKEPVVSLHLRQHLLIFSVTVIIQSSNSLHRFVLYGYIPPKLTMKISQRWFLGNGFHAVSSSKYWSYEISRKKRQPSTYPHPPFKDDYIILSRFKDLMRA